MNILIHRTLILTSMLVCGATVAQTVAEKPVTTEAYFGNFHVHTSLSFDGFANGSVTKPDDAYRWAKGEAIAGGGDGSLLKILKPLDWYMVSDHAELLGVFPSMADPDSPLSKLEIANRVTSNDPVVAFQAFSDTLADMSAGTLDPALVNPKIGESIWAQVVKSAEDHNAPGEFTTFAGFEWTSNPEKQNLHRVVVFRGSKNLPQLPFSSYESDRPEDLWKWMEQQRVNGAEVLAIPHNGNASNGLMFPQEKSYGGSNLDDGYAQLRTRNEPVYEITQIKGSSDTHPLLSPSDEFSNFEIWDYTLSADAKPPQHKKGGYARDALMRGLEFEARGRKNPFRFGLIGDSDSHNSAAMIEENNYRGKFGMENNTAHRLNGIPGMPEANNKQVREFGSGGVAGIWAESNTREALFDAVMRKETFATSGPRMKVRFFAGYDFPQDMMESADWVTQAYAHGVAMGGEICGTKQAGGPRFLVMAAMESDGAYLDRIQIIKAWVENGKSQEQIFDVALGGENRQSRSGAVVAVGDTVDATAATYQNSIGAPQLSANWTDPQFKAEQHAVYYARILQIPTPRWSTYDAKTLGIPPRDELPVAIQERAWSSPIWYRPR